jgi:hypothetical protein
MLMAKGLRFVESTKPGEHGRCRLAPAVLCPNVSGDATSIVVCVPVSYK